MAEGKGILCEYIENVWNRGDMMAADAFFPADHILHDAHHPWVTRGAEGMKRLVTLYRDGLPDLSAEIQDITEDTGTVITRFKISGTHTRSLFGLAPTGNKVDVDVVEIDRVEDGKIVESRMLWDMLGLLQQLGVAPKPPMEEGSEEVDLSFAATHKLWWQGSNAGTDEPHDKEHQDERWQQ